MSTNVSDWFAGLATIGGFLYFLAGFAAAYATHFVRAKMRNQAITIPWHLAGIAVGVVAIVITSFQSQLAYGTAKQTAQEVQQCQREFNAALQARARITIENDELSQQQRQIVFHWIHDLILPPEPWLSMDPNDPLRRAYVFDRTIRTEQKFRASLDSQDELQRQRERTPLPDPTCGQ